VVTASQIRARLGAERKKELFDCPDDASHCLAEIGQSLGVDGLVSGGVVLLDQGYAISLKIIRVKDGQAVASFASPPLDEHEALGWLAARARVFATQEESGGGWKHARAAGIVVGASGIAAGAVGLGLYVASRAQVTQLQSNTPPITTQAQLTSVANAAQLNQTLGVILMFAGAVGLAVGAGMVAAGPPSVTPQVSVGPNGSFSLAVGGVF
jgi:hypothetical protein